MPKIADFSHFFLLTGGQSLWLGGNAPCPLDAATDSVKNVIDTFKICKTWNIEVMCQAGNSIFFIIFGIQITFQVPFWKFHLFSNICHHNYHSMHAICQISFSEVLDDITSFKTIPNLKVYAVSFWRYKNILFVQF